MKITFRINYHTQWGENLAVVIGDRKYPMTWNEGDVWAANINVKAADLKSYTYEVLENNIVLRVEWKSHKSEIKKVIEDSWNDCPFPGCDFIRECSSEKFNRPGFRGAGTAVPVFSLRSEDDFGIGDFRDLHILVDWAVRTGQSVIQLLPVGDTTRMGDWKDSYPYSPVSSFALHPIYIRLQDLGVRADSAFRKEQAALNALPEIDYPRVYKTKMSYIREAWRRRGAKDLETVACRRFIEKNSYWLDEYSAFCAHRDGMCPEFYSWLQYHLDKQFGKEADYARSRGISLKGDLPIGVSADSAEAHYHPELFNLDSSAGAPPDFFSADGQNWGFPTYNWTAMAEDGYAWWKSRLRRMSRYFDAYRIDHILGWFRIWEIPIGKTGRDGHFNPAIPYTPGDIAAAGLLAGDGLWVDDPRNPGCFQPRINPDTSGLDGTQKQAFDAIWEDFFFHRNEALWKEEAEKKLPELLGATGMLACGEDLGMVPECVPGVMEKQRILSLEMPMMDKGRPWPRLSVCATSSHDMATLRMQRPEDPEPWEVRNLLWQSLDSESMLAIFPLQDWMALSGTLRRSDRNAERINEPADPNHHWRYRMHLNLEELMNGKAAELNADIESLLKDSRRWNQI